jgi:uncharacterized glyoxalase superfamily protein PhnB
MTIHFLEKVRADILRLPLDNGLLRMVEDAQQMGELKTFPLVLDLYSEEMFDAVFLQVRIVLMRTSLLLL